MEHPTRAAAGAAYAHAVENFAAAWLELCAHDHAANAAHHFRGVPDLSGFLHAEFMPTDHAMRASAHLVARARERASIICAVEA
jgi:hypothetical protein